MDFGQAIKALKDGKRVSRAGWNGKGMWLLLVKAYPWGEFEGKQFLFDSISEATDFLPWVGMKTADHKFVPWLASQTDILSEDWGIIE